MVQFFSKFLYVLQGERRKLFMLIGLFLFISLLEAVATGMVGPFIGLATNPNSINTNPWLNFIYQKLHLTSALQMIWIFGGIVISLFYLKVFLNFNANRYIFQFGYGQQRKLSSRLMRAYLAAPYTFHLTRNSAVLIQNIVNETDRFVNNLLLPLLTSASNAVVMVALVTLLIMTDITATITIAGILLIAISLYFYLKDKLSRWGQELSESRTEMIRVINHALGGFKETRVIGCEAYFERQLDEQAKIYTRSVSLAINFSTLPRFAIEAFLVTFLIVFTIVFVTSNQGKSENLTAVLGVFALSSIRLMPAASNLLNYLNEVKYNAYTLDKLYLDLKESEQFDRPQYSPGADLPLNSLDHSQKLSFQDQVVLKSIVYRYPNAEKTALENMSLDIKKGQAIGLIGKSGAGKTTLVDIILGLLTPESGDIQVDHQSIYRDLRSWQNLVGYVPQFIFLIDDTLERNIAFGVPEDLIDSARIQQAIDSAQLSELVDQLPLGLQTMVGERGVLLSGGQRQRVGIARALYHEREILVLDEATAALDQETESLVTDAIRSLSGTKTMIIIAHRLSTLEHCDRLYVLEQGKIVKSGSYQEVVLTKSAIDLESQELDVS